MENCSSGRREIETVVLDRLGDECLHAKLVVGWRENLSRLLQHFLQSLDGTAAIEGFCRIVITTFELVQGDVFRY